MVAASAVFPLLKDGRMTVAAHWSTLGGDLPLRRAYSLAEEDSLCPSQI